MVAYLGYLAQLLYERNAVALAARRRLGDEHAALLQLGLQRFGVLRQEIGARVEPKLLRPVLPEFIEDVAERSLVAEVGHRGQTIHEHLSRHEVLVDRQGESRPHDISSFEDLNPVIVLDDGFDQSQLASAVAGVHLHPLFAVRVLLPHVELRGQLFLAGLRL